MERSRIGKSVKTKLASLAIFAALSGGCQANGGPWSATVDGDGNVAFKAQSVNINGTPIGGDQLMGVGTPEALPATITSLRFQPNQSELNGGITKPTDQPGQERFVNEYLQAAMDATKAPTHEELDFEYPGKTPTDDLYEVVDGLLQEARDANATIFHGKANEGMMIPTNTASVTWCNATDPNQLMELAQEMEQLQAGGKFNFAIYTSSGIYHPDNLDGFIRDEASLVDGRSMLFLTMPTDATLAESPSVYQTDVVCDHPLGSASVAVR